MGTQPQEERIEKKRKGTGQVNCNICLKSAGLHEFFGWFWVVLFVG